jgi:hypothetical protein
MCTLFNYADDDTLFYVNKDINDLVAGLTLDTEIAVQWFKDNGMKANPEKFQAIVSHRYHTPNITFNVSNMHIVSQDCVKLFGVTIDRTLSFYTHIDDLCKKASRQLNVLKRISSTLSVKNKILIYQTFILSNFSYCPIVWNFCAKGKVAMMEKIQKRALRFVFNDLNSPYKELLVRVGKDTLQTNRLKCLAVQVFKCIHKISPHYLHSMFNRKTSLYDLRDASLLVQPKVNTVSYGLLSFRYHGAKVWNSLPSHIKSAQTLSDFKLLINSWSGPLCTCSFCSCD